MKGTIVREHRGGTGILTLAHEHDICTAPDLRRELLACDATRRTVLDLDACTLIDGTILGVLAVAAERTGDLHGELVVINAHGVVARALQITGMDRVLHCSCPPDEIVLPRQPVATSCPGGGRR